jgi:surfactin synthase thioesterase subunit
VHWLTSLQPGNEAGAAAARPRVAQCESLGRLEAVRARLFCFHDAGGSPTTFIPFGRLNAAGIEVHTIAHARSEPASPEVAELYLEEATRYIRGFSDRPYALFGHSLGGFFAWRTALALCASRAPAPIFVAPSASVVPTWFAEGATDEALRRAAQRLRRPNVPLASSFEADFIADASLWRSMHVDDAQQLEAPIVAFVGADDGVASERQMAEWAQRSRRGFSLTVLPGDHFYLFDEAARATLLEELKRRLPGAP